MQAADFAEEKNRLSIIASGLWRMNADGVAPIDRSYVGPATVLVPNEDILVVVTDLPLASRRQREAAAPYAVEGLIAQPLDDVHVAVGSETVPPGHLCAIVSKLTMTRWVSALQLAGLDHAVLLPDALNLPVPPKGHWCVCLEQRRVRVRADDASGFAIPAEHLAMAWEAAGRPQIYNQGEALPPALAAAEVEPADGSDPGATVSGLSPVERFQKPLPVVDLRQGHFAAKARSSRSLISTLAIIFGIGLACHLAIFAADTAVLNHKANLAQTRVEALKAQQEMQASSRSSQRTAGVVPEMEGGDGPFLSQMGRVSEAIRGQDLKLGSISYIESEPLLLSLTFSDPAVLERTLEAFKRYGLAAAIDRDLGPQAAVQGGRLNATIRIGNTGEVR